jgi:hypothetical protein
MSVTFYTSILPTRFWNLGDFIPTDSLGGAPGSQTCPSIFFPELKCALGKPLGPPAKVPGSKWAYTRSYEHAAVHADLSNQTATRVAFTSC